MKSLIDKHLAMGSTVEQVDSFLDSQGIEKSGYKEDIEPLFAPDENKQIPERKRFILGRIRNVGRRNLTTWDMFLIFYFDADRKLIEYQIKLIGMGP